MKNTLIFTLSFLAICFFSCQKDKAVNDKFDIYGLYISVDTSQFIQQINFAEPYVHVWYKDSTETKYQDYEIINNQVFSDSLVFEIINYDKNNSIELFHIDSMVNIIFPPRQ
jgi:hypothetical protein